MNADIPAPQEPTIDPSLTLWLSGLDGSPRVSSVNHYPEQVPTAAIVEARWLLGKILEDRGIKSAF